MENPIRIAIIGTAKRSDHFYGPLLQHLPGVELVSVWGRTMESAKKLGESLHVPSYIDIDKLIRETSPQIGIVSVAYGANGQVGLMAVDRGLNVLLETPIAHKLSEADDIINMARTRGVKIEIAEQFHRRPLEQIKLKLIASGLFGRVHTSFNDFAGHGYHGISVMRSYLGFDAKPVRVVGSVHVAYDSPLRWWRSSRFLAERGMGITIGDGRDIQELLSLLTPDGEAPAFITLERRWERVDGGALEAIVAHTGDANQPLVRWDNPFVPAHQGHGPQWHDDEIGVASCIMSLVDAVRNNTEPSYGPAQGRLDQELILAIRQSAAEGNRPVSLPLDPDKQTF